MHRPRRSILHDLTARGWVVLTAVCCTAAAVGGLAISAGDDPCTWTVTTVECQP